MIWPESYLNQQLINAGQDIAKQVQCVWQRFVFPINAGQDTYTLPSYVRGVMDVQFHGNTLDAANWDDLTIITPATVAVSPNPTNNAYNIVSQEGRPLWYAMHPTNLLDIRFYPTPGLTLTALPSDNPYATTNALKCIITCWRAQDDSDPAGILPSYVNRRMRKAYALNKAFRIRGKGQNLKAADYYLKMYNFLLQRFRQINSEAYFGQRPSLDDGNLFIDSFRYPRPTLPPNFEHTIY